MHNFRIYNLYLWLLRSINVIPHSDISRVSGDFNEPTASKLIDKLIDE